MYHPPGKEPLNDDKGLAAALAHIPRTDEDGEFLPYTGSIKGVWEASAGFHGSPSNRAIR